MSSPIACYQYCYGHYPIPNRMLEFYQGENSCLYTKVFSIQKEKKEIYALASEKIFVEYSEKACDEAARRAKLFQTKIVKGIAEVDFRTQLKILEELEPMGDWSIRFAWNVDIMVNPHFEILEKITFYSR